VKTIKKKYSADLYLGLGKVAQGRIRVEDAKLFRKDTVSLDLLLIWRNGKNK